MLRIYPQSFLSLWSSGSILLRSILRRSSSKASLNFAELADLIGVIGEDVISALDGDLIKKLVFSNLDELMLSYPFSPLFLFGAMTPRLFLDGDSLRLFIGANFLYLSFEEALEFWLLSSL